MLHKVALKKKKKNSYTTLKVVLKKWSNKWDS